MKDPWAEDEQFGSALDGFGNSFNGNEENNGMTAINGSLEDPFCLTLKQQGKDAPWLVLRANSAADLVSRLKETRESGLIEEVNQTQRLFAGSPAPQAAPAQPQQSYQAPQQQSAPQGDGRTCAHGQMTYREGQKKNGGTYKAYFCPEQDRNQQCRPIWLS